VDFNGKDELIFHFGAGPSSFAEKIWNHYGLPSAGDNWRAFRKAQNRPREGLFGCASYGRQTSNRSLTRARLNSHASRKRREVPA
jgi:hypothetical protein